MTHKERDNSTYELPGSQNFDARCKTKLLIRQAK